MRKTLTLLALLFVFAVTGCAPTPEENFSTVIRSINALSGTGKEDLTRLLNDTPVDHYTDKDTPKIVMYQKYVVLKSVFDAESGLRAINEIPTTEDTKEMLITTQVLHAFVITLYKDKYSKIGALKDKGASKEEIDTAIEAFHAAHDEIFMELYNNAFDSTMKYAKQHGIKVTIY